MRNRSSVTEFILLGLTGNTEIQAVIFFSFFTYVLNVAGNLIIIILILLDSHLKTPMCFFLRNFSFLEISFTSVCIPRFFYEDSNWRQIYLLYCSCSWAMFLYSIWFNRVFFSWYLCPMIVTWLSANLCIIRPSWVTRSTTSL